MCTISEGEEASPSRAGEFLSSTCSNTAPPTTFSALLRVLHDISPVWGKNQMKANPPLVLCHRERRSTHGALRRFPRRPRSCPHTAPAFCLPSCPAPSRRIAPGSDGNGCNKRSHKSTRCAPGRAAPLPSRAAPSPFRQNIVRPGGQRRGGARPPSLLSHRPPGLRGNAGEGARPLTGRAAAPGQGQPGSSVSIWHCPPAAPGHPAVSAREGSHCHPARLFLTNY